VVTPAEAPGDIERREQHIHVGVGAVAPGLVERDGALGRNAAVRQVHADHPAVFPLQTVNRAPRIRLQECQLPRVDTHHAQKQLPGQTQRQRHLRVDDALARRHDREIVQLHVIGCWFLVVGTK